MDTSKQPSQFRVVPDPAINECSWRIVRRRYEAGDFEDEYREAFERLHRLVPQSTREAQAAEEVIEEKVKALADWLEDALQNWLARQDPEKWIADALRLQATSHDKVGRWELPHWPRS